MAISGAEFAALSPLQQQSYLNGDPNYLSAAPAAPTPQQTQTAEIAGLAASDNYVILPFGSSTEQVWTLDTYLSQVAAAQITFPASLQGQDPVANMQALAQQRCAAIPTPDCANLTQLATQYGSQVRAATGAAAFPAAAPAATPSAAPSPAFAPTAPASATVPTGPAPGAAAPHSVYSAPATVLQPRLTAGGGGGVDVPKALSYIPIIGPILASLVSLFFGGNDLAGLTKAVNQLAQETAQIGDSITRFTWSVANAVGAMWEFQAETWDNFLDSFWTDFKNVWKAVWTHLAATIPAILTIIHNLRQKLDEIYQKYIFKILKWIQLARRFLIFLKLLHVPFAAKLDKIIGQIQSALFFPFAYLLRWVSGLAAWYNLILAWDLTIQRPVFLRTMWKYQNDWINMWWNQQTPVGTAWLTPPPDLTPTGETPKQSAAVLQSWLATTPGNFPADIQQANTDLQTDLQAA